MIKIDYLRWTTLHNDYKSNHTAPQPNDKNQTKLAQAASAYTTSQIQTTSLIIVITQTGDTITYLSQYDFNCPILAICNDRNIARFCKSYHGVVSLEVGSQIGTETVIEKGIEFALSCNLIKKGDNIILLVGTVENVSGATNCMKIMKA